MLRSDAVRNLVLLMTFVCASSSSIGAVDRLTDNESEDRYGANHGRLVVRDGPGRVERALGSCP